MTIRWDYIISYLPMMFKGAWMTLELTTIAVGIGVAIGLVVALARLSSLKPLSKLAGGYVDFFRGTPLLVQIFLIYYGLPGILGYSANAFLSGIAALGINSGAYVAEIFRAGIQSIDKGQSEAARSLGMTAGQTMRYVILPQAVKRVIPPLGNEFIALLKDSSLVAMIALQELTMTAKIMQGATYRPFESFLTAAVFYLIMTMVISRLMVLVERRFDLGSD